MIYVNFVLGHMIPLNTEKKSGRIVVFSTYATVLENPVHPPMTLNAYTACQICPCVCLPYREHYWLRQCIFICLTYFY